MTKQEMFDRVLTFLRKQGKASREPGGGICLYRDRDGGMCAAGCLMPDEVYMPMFEGSSLTQLMQGVTLDGEILPKKALQDLETLFLNELEFVDRLQIAHDRNLTVNGLANWEEAMKVIAVQFELTYTAP